MAVEMKFEGRKKIPYGINLVPLINIVFLLLIFFMLSTTLVTPDKFDIELPVSDKKDSLGTGPIVVLIKADGSVALNNTLLTMNQLSSFLESQIRTGLKPELMIRADASANTADVVSVLRQAKIAGIERVSLATQIKNFP